MSIFRCDHAPLIAQLRADLAAADARATAAEQRNFTLEARYDALLQTLALKTAGAQVVPAAGGVVEPLPPLPVQQPDALKALIHAMAGDDTRKRAMMLRQLAVDRSAGVHESEIEESIRRGVSPEGVPI